MASESPHPNSPQEGTGPTRIVQYRLLRQTDEIIVLDTALLGMVPFWTLQVPLSGSIATQAMTIGGVAIVTVWILTLEVNRVRAFIRDYKFSTVTKSSVQTAAVLITLSLVACCGVVPLIAATHIKRVIGCS